MSERHWMKEPCAQCPFRADVMPYLHPRRAADLAYQTQNRYSEFFCHKTLDHDDAEEGDPIVGSKSLVCAGFLSMQVGECIEAPEGFEPSGLVYGDVYQMIDAYEEAAEGRS